MAYEIERKFLITGDFRPYIASSYPIRQGYLHTDTGEGCTVRVRTKGNKAFFTVKGPGSPAGITHSEWEYEIPLADAEEMLLLCKGRIIDKIRHEIPCGNFTFEVDEFLGNNKGLLLAEIELPSENAAFDRPAWLGEEVTGNRRYYNSQLAACPYKGGNKAGWNKNFLINLLKIQKH